MNATEEAMRRRAEAQRVLAHCDNKLRAYQEALEELAEKIRRGEGLQITESGTAIFLAKVRRTLEADDINDVIRFENKRMEALREIASAEKTLADLGTPI